MTDKKLSFEVEAQMDTTHGKFKIRAYRYAGDPAIVLFRGNLKSKKCVVRVQSSCLFGESFGSVDCDCKWQVVHSLDQIGANESGVLIYLFQEGRGIGIVDKVRVYAIQQEHGCDSATAFKMLKFDQTDLRNYDSASAILKHLGVNEGVLLTNNPEKAESLNSSGLNLKAASMYDEPDDFKSLIKMVGNANKERIFDYLRFKRDVLGHDFSDPDLS